MPDHAAAHARASPGARGARARLAARDREPVPQVPVIAADGHTYDRSAIERWLLHHDNSPKTGERLEHRMLVPNHNLKRLVDDLVLEGGAGFGSGEHPTTQMCVEFLERYARFKEKEENRQDIQQENWITAELKNGIVADLVPSTSEIYIVCG